MLETQLFWWEGVPDYMTSPISADPHRAILHSRGKADLSILLAHQPRGCNEAAKAGFNLQLSGHTHAGQFHPWTWVVKLLFPYVKGLHNHEGMWVYVNQGTGFWGLRYDLEHDQKLPISNLEMNNCLKIYQLKHNFALPVS